MPYTDNVTSQDSTLYFAGGSPLITVLPMLQSGFEFSKEKSRLFFSGHDHCTVHYSLALRMAASGFAAATEVAELLIVSAGRAIYASYLNVGRRPRSRCSRHSQVAIKPELFL